MYARGGESTLFAGPRALILSPMSRRPFCGVVMRSRMARAEGRGSQGGGREREREREARRTEEKEKGPSVVAPLAAVTRKEELAGEEEVEGAGRKYPYMKEPPSHVWLL
jgi:hypothetical protein